jgi:AGZA family xanthine/uracil permease-like MFS transporter
VFSFLFVGVFDTVGSLVGVARAAGLVRPDGKLPRAGRALASDALGTTAGALLGTSTVVAYIESASGVTAGGRTGLCAVTTAVLLLAAALLGPLAAAVPAHATAPALILVGALMMGAAAEVPWDDVTEAVPAFLTVAAIPLTYSIATGLALGFVAWPLLKAATGRAQKVHPLVWALAALFVARYALLPGS